jgi:hypothetical protein
VTFDGVGTSRGTSPAGNKMGDSLFNPYISPRRVKSQNVV